MKEILLQRNARINKRNEAHDKKRSPKDDMWSSGSDGYLYDFAKR